MKGRVLVVAGSDSGGGAGLQADIKVVTMLGGYAATAVTALTAQNTLAVHEVFSIPPKFIARQMEVVLDDIGADCIKIGMLGSVGVINAVADCLALNAKAVPVVLDPVMVATSGSMLLEKGAIRILMERLMAGAAVVTPNLPEAEALTGKVIENLDDMQAAAGMILAMGPRAVLLKGGHMGGDNLTDLLLTADGAEMFENQRVNTLHTHGTGCSLAAAIATGLAQGMSLRDAVIRARLYVLRALQTAPGFGKGFGPINHGVLLD